MTAEEKMSRAFLVVIGAFVALFLVVVALVFFSVSKALAQEHHHRPQDANLHDQFYKTWMMPENRSISCCHDQDCQPAQAYEKDGSWYAKQDGDDKGFTKIPPQKIEQERDSPDGRSHLCGRRYFFSGEFTVFCFLPAGGT